MRARQNLNSKRCYCVATGDLNLFKRNFLACLQEVTSSLGLFRVARSGLQIIKYFSHKHKLQRLEAGLKGAACFKIFQVILKANLTSFKRQMCFSSVLSLLFGSLNDNLWFANLVLTAGTTTASRSHHLQRRPRTLQEGTARETSFGTSPLLARTLLLTWDGHFVRSWMRNSRRTTRCIRFLTGILLRSVTVACPT